MSSNGVVYVVLNKGKGALCNLPKQQEQQTNDVEDVGTLLIRFELQDFSASFVIFSNT